jgi:O-antigen ligase
MKKFLYIFGAVGVILLLSVSPLYFGIPEGRQAQEMVASSSLSDTPSASALESVARGFVYLTSTSFPNAWAHYVIIVLGICAVLALLTGHVPAVVSRGVMYAGFGWGIIMIGMLFAEQKLPLAWKDNRMCAHFLLYGVWFFIVATFLDTARRRQIALLMLMLTGTFVCYWAFDQYRFGLDEMRQLFAQNQGFESFTSYTNSIVLAELDPKALLTVKKIASNRVFSTFVYPNALGGFLIVLIPICIGCFMSFRFGPAKLLSGMVLLFAAGALMLSRSKASIGIVSLCLLVLAYYARHARALSNAAWIFLSLCIVAAAAGMLFWGYGTGLAERLQATGGARLDYWDAAIKMIRDNPWRGWGSSGFTRNYLVYCRPGAEYTRLAHNALLNIWTDYGIGGLVGLIIAFTLPLMVGLWHIATTKPFNWISSACFVAALGFVLHCQLDFDFHILGIVIPALTALVFAQMPVKEEEIPQGN